MSESRQVNDQSIVAQLSEQLGDEPLGDEQLGDTVLAWAQVPTDRQQRILSTLAVEVPPACVVYPQTVDALAQVMTAANEAKWRVQPMGQGSKLSWGGLAEGIDIVVSTARLNRVVEHAVGDFTVTVEAGLKVTDLQRQLAAEGQLLAIDPAFESAATVGGVVATADTGSLRQRYGGLRDMLIGLQFVRYDGQTARAGGRVVKNVAGYDLMKLMTGSYGSLGILSELTFRLYPIPATSRSLVLIGGETAIEQAISEVRFSGLAPIALDLVPSGMATELLSAVAVSSDLSQLDISQLDLSQKPMALIARFQGIADGVEEQSDRLKKIATTHRLLLQQLDGKQDSAFWQQVSELIVPESVLCKVGMRPSALPALLAQLAPGSCQAKVHGSSGLGWIQWPAAKAHDADFLSLLQKVRSHAQDNGGFLSLLQAPPALKRSIDIWGYKGNALSVMGDLKEKFDPHRLLCPGRFVGGL